MGKACYKCMRFTVLTFNFLFVFIGVGVLACAIFATVDESTKNFLKFSGQDDYVTYTLYGLMAVGGVTMLIGLFGCCGAYHESQCLLSTYFIFLLLILGAEAAAGALGFIYNKKLGNPLLQWVTRWTIDKEILSRIDEAIIKEQTAKKAAMKKEMKIDALQQYLRCCGADGPSDYGASIPYSCCNEMAYTKAQCGKATISIEKAYTAGCKKQYKDFIKSNFLIILCIIIGIAAVELFGLIFAIATCCAIRSRERAYTTVEAHDDPYR